MKALLTYVRLRFQQGLVKSLFGIMSILQNILGPETVLPRLEDDIKCREWLYEVGFPQYHETFITNFGIGSDLLSRRRLRTIRLQDFPNMNICDYDHAKILMDHIKLTLEFSFDSSDRIREVTRRGSVMTNTIKLPEISSKKMILPTSLADVRINDSPRRAKHERYINSSRRKAFDKKVWKSINRYRDDGKANAVQSLRGGFNEPVLEASFSPTNKTSDVTVASPRHAYTSKAKTYGDNALDYDTLIKQLKTLQNESLAHYRNLVNCEVANIFFVNEKKRELMLYVTDKWFKISIDTGIAGYVARTGESLNIPDAYADSRFNRGMDKKTGFRTKSILCQPIRSKHGGGVVAVIQMINKKDGDFDSDDITIVDTCVEKLSEDLEERFKDLISLSDKMAGMATSVNQKQDKMNYMSPKSSTVRA